MQERHSHLLVTLARIWTYTLLAAVVVLVTINTTFALSVLVISLILYYLLRPLVKRLEVYISTTKAATLSFLALVLLTAVILLISLPPVFNQIGLFADQIPQALNNLQQWILTYGIEVDISALSLVIEERSEAIVSNSLGLAVTLITLLLQFFLAALIAFNLLVDGPSLYQNFKAFIPKKWGSDLEVVRGSMHNSFGTYMFIQGATAIFSFFLTWIILVIFNISFAPIIALLTALLAFIPFFGPIFGFVFPPLLTLLFGGDPGVALWILLIALIGQQIFANVVVPSLVGSKMGVHPVLVILGLLVVAQWGGAYGLVVGIPLIGMVQALIVHLHNKLEDPEYYKNFMLMPDRRVNSKPIIPPVESSNTNKHSEDKSL